MTFEKAEEIISKYLYWMDLSCSCFLGNPPCSKCEGMPSEEDYEEAVKTLEQED
jgi:hypothetical protein